MTESTQEATHISSWAFLFFWFFFFNINSCQKQKITSRLLSEKYTNRKCLFLTSPPVCKPLPHPGELRPFSSLIHCHFMNHMLTGLWRRRCVERGRQHGKEWMSPSSVEEWICHSQWQYIAEQYKCWWINLWDWGGRSKIRTSGLHTSEFVLEPFRVRGEEVKCTVRETPNC